MSLRIIPETLRNGRFIVDSVLIRTNIETKDPKKNSPSVVAQRDGLLPFVSVLARRSGRCVDETSPTEGNGT